MQFCNLKKGEFATHNKFNILVRIGLSMLAKYLIIITDIPYYMLTLILEYLSTHLAVLSSHCFPALYPGLQITRAAPLP